MKYIKKSDIALFVVILAIDLISKQVITSMINLYETVTVIPNFFWLTYYQNTGMAWSLFNNVPFLLTLVSLGITVFLLFIYKDALKHNETFMRICCVLMLAGAIGNLYDRIALGYVRDFLAFNIFGYHFPVFNIADSSLVIGGILWVIYCITVEGKVKK